MIRSRYSLVCMVTCSCGSCRGRGRSESPPNITVDFPDLGAVVRADGQAGFIPSIQIGGRAQRVFEGKPFGIVVDFTDRFCQALQRRAQTRLKAYKQEGWEIVHVDSSGD